MNCFKTQNCVQIWGWTEISPPMFQHSKYQHQHKLCQNHPAILATSFHTAAFKHLFILFDITLSNSQAQTQADRLQVLSSLGFLLWSYPQGFKTRLLERGFYILIRNVSFLSLTDVGSHLMSKFLKVQWTRKKQGNKSFVERNRERQTSEVSKSIAKWCSNTKIFGSLTTASKRARSISLPVISAAWTILRWECPPSLARCKLPSSPWSNEAPIAINSLTLSGPSVHTT